LHFNRHLNNNPLPKVLRSVLHLHNSLHHWRHGRFAFWQNTWRAFGGGIVLPGAFRKQVTSPLHALTARGATPPRRLHPPPASAPHARAAHNVNWWRLPQNVQRGESPPRHTGATLPPAAYHSGARAAGLHRRHSLPNTTRTCQLRISTTSSSATHARGGRLPAGTFGPQDQFLR